MNKILLKQIDHFTLIGILRKYILIALFININEISFIIIIIIF